MVTAMRNWAPAAVEGNGSARLKVLTISREYGSGGGAVARRVADKLGWRLLDQALIDAIARIAQVDLDTVRQFDEHADAVHGVDRHALRSFAAELGLPPVDLQYFDADTMAEYTRYVITSAAARGETVIVGRGGPCVLQDYPDAFHVFVHAPWAVRLARIRKRVQGCDDIEELVRLTDSQRSSYVRKYYGCDWKNPHLYHMMITSQFGIERTASIIVDAVERGGRG